MTQLKFCTTHSPFAVRATDDNRDANIVPRIKNLRPSIGILSPRIARPLDIPKHTDKHYLTHEHRAWRVAVIERAGRCCQGCGRRGVRLFADHKIERADGGADFDVNNGQALCGSCHVIKTNAARKAREARQRDQLPML